ncbi:MAG: DUF3108 domain-containing protein [Alphaproteobacteria bacterium]|nr:DUF3108 domain-containing protein [Alphaproteobacteria bacterium]
MIRQCVTPLLMMFAASGAANAAERLEATYDFLWNGIRVSTAEARADLMADRYDLSIGFRMRGLAKLFSNGRSVVTAKGAYGGEYNVIPVSYDSSGRWDGEDYSRSLTFTPEGSLLSLEQDWPEKWQEDFPREDVPAELKRGPDPASIAVALMTAEISAITTGDVISIPVFDGETVIEWQMQCSAEAVELENSSHSDFAGPAHECMLGTKLVAGKRILTEKEKKKLEKGRAKREKKKNKGKEEDHRPRFWVMADEQTGYLLPVRAEMESGMGRVMMYLKELQVTDLDADSIAAR